MAFQAGPLVVRRTARSAVSAAGQVGDEVGGVTADCYHGPKRVRLLVLIQVKSKHEQEFAAKKVKVYLTSWRQVRRLR